MNLQQTNTANQSTALKVVPVKCIGIKKITRLNNESVYNMSVENVHNFAINGGLIVHNCDALRYALHEQIQALQGGLQFTQEDLAYFSQPHESY